MNSMKQNTSGAFTLLQTEKNTSETEKPRTKTKIMKQKRNRVTTSAGLFAAALLLSTFNFQLSTLFAQGTAFSYQGRLSDNGSPANGNYDLTFALFSVSSGVGQLGNTITNSPTGVTNGLFTVTLDFGAGVFTGPARWLEIGARTNGNGSLTTLSP